MEGAALLAGLEDGSLPPQQFGHRSHVHAAWQCLQTAPLRDAAHRFRDLLEAYTRRIGAEDRFHQTLTLAFMHLIFERLVRGESWAEFEAGNVDLLANARGLMEQHYSPEVLDRGRKVFATPDRLPLP